MSGATTHCSSGDRQPGLKEGGERKGGRNWRRKHDNNNKGLTHGISRAIRTPSKKTLIAHSCLGKEKREGWSVSDEGAQLKNSLVRENVRSALYTIELGNAYG